MWRERQTKIYVTTRYAPIRARQSSIVSGVIVAAVTRMPRLPQATESVSKKSFARIVSLLRAKQPLKTLSTFATVRHANLVMGQLTLARASLVAAWKGPVKPTVSASTA